MDACPACHAINPEGFRFCGQCGTALSVISCPSCGQTNPAGQRFCGHCGSTLDGTGTGTGAAATPTATPAAVDERKLATVLFADVVGFTSLAERTDPEVVARIVDGAFRRLGEVVAEHGGTVDKYMGDSVMAVFGVPAAHDDDAQRAVAAGLAIRELGGDLAFSIGINSGEVMVTAVGRAGDMTVIGDTVNVAARLEKAAGPGDVLCGKLTAELAGRRVWFRERQPVPLKGKREPVEVWEALALRGAGDSDGDGASEAGHEQPPLVGRDDELAYLDALWRRVGRDHQTQVVLLCGEAGSGKTRLADELARMAAMDGTVVRTTYPAYGAMGGMRVAAEIVRQLGPVDDDDVNARVRSVAGEIDPSLQSIDPAAVEQEQLWAFGRLLQQKADERPLLIVIDDMHHSGDRTLELLGELFGRFGGMALLTVLAGRTEPGEWLSRFPAATTVRLGPLSRSDAAALADAFVCDKPLTPAAADFFVDRANGNPLYLREMVNMARDRGALVDDGDSYELTGQAAIPVTLQALLAARLDALEPGQKVVLQHVAVLGDAASGEQVAALGSTYAEPALRSLVDLGLLEFSPDGHYRAADSLLRELAYETLPRNVRGDLHRRAATAASRSEDRARHLDRAAEYLSDDEEVAAEAADAMAETAELFVQASRHVDALRLLERSVALGCRRPSVLLSTAKLQSLCGKQSEALETLAMIPDDPDDPSVAVERDHTAANTRTFTDPGSAVGRLEEVAERWRLLGNVEKEAWARANTGVAYFYLSRMEEAAASLERGLAMFEQLDDRTGAVATSSFLCLAKPTDHRVPHWLADALEFADQTGDRSKQMTTLTTLSWHHFFRSLCGRPEDTAEAEGFATRLAELAEEIGAGDMAVHAWSLLAIMARFTGRLDAAGRHVAALQRTVSQLHNNELWLSWAASFSVAVANGATGAAPPFPPEDATDPVVGMAGIVVAAELTLAGRLDEAVGRLVSADRPDLGPISDLVGVWPGLALVLVGRPADASPLIQRAAGAAHVLGARPIETAAAALKAEIDGSTSELPPPPSQIGGISDALVVRAHAMTGGAAAGETLRQAATAFGMPGLLAGL